MRSRRPGLEGSQRRSARALQGFRCLRYRGKDGQLPAWSLHSSAGQDELLLAALKHANAVLAAPIIIRVEHVTLKLAASVSCGLHAQTSTVVQLSDMPLVSGVRYSLLEGLKPTCCGCSAEGLWAANMSKGCARLAVLLGPGGASSGCMLLSGLSCGDCWGVTWR